MTRDRVKAIVEPTSVSRFSQRNCGGQAAAVACSLYVMCPLLNLSAERRDLESRPMSDSDSVSAQDRIRSRIHLLSKHQRRIPRSSFWEKPRGRTEDTTSPAVRRSNVATQFSSPPSCLHNTRPRHARFLPEQRWSEITTDYKRTSLQQPMKFKLFGPWLGFWPIRKAGLLSRVWNARMQSCVSRFWTTYVTTYIHSPSSSQMVPSEHCRPSAHICREAGLLRHAEETCWMPRANARFHDNNRRD